MDALQIGRTVEYFISSFLSNQKFLVGGSVNRTIKEIWPNYQAINNNVINNSALQTVQTPRSVCQLINKLELLV